jgi:AcrR family transcriptional regulator
MAAVAEGAGVTRRAVYLHFPSRADLVAALFDYVTEEEHLADSLSDVWSSPDSVAALDAWAHHIARFHTRVMTVTRAVEQVHRTDPDAAAHRDRYLQEQLAACTRLASWLESEGRLAPGWSNQVASEMLWALISVEMFERLIIERHWSNGRLAKYLSQLLQSAFTVDARQKAAV